MLYPAQGTCTKTKVALGITTLSASVGITAYWIRENSKATCINRLSALSTLYQRIKETAKSCSHPGTFKVPTNGVIHAWINLKIPSDLKKFCFEYKNTTLPISSYLSQYNSSLSFNKKLRTKLPDAIKLYLKELPRVEQVCMDGDPYIEEMTYLMYAAIAIGVLGATYILHQKLQNKQDTDNKKHT